MAFVDWILFYVVFGKGLYSFISILFYKGHIIKWNDLPEYKTTKLRLYGTINGYECNYMHCFWIYFFDFLHICYKNRAISLPLS